MKLWLIFISEVCFIVKRSTALNSNGGELRIVIDSTEIATYPDGDYQEKRYCQNQIQYGALITFDAVAENDRVCSTWLNRSNSHHS